MRGALGHEAQDRRAREAGAPARPGDEGTTVEARTEERLARAMAYARAGTALLLPVPLVRGRQLGRPALALAASGAGLLQSLLYLRRTRSTGTLRDPLLVWGDVGSCCLVSLLASRSVPPAERNTGMIQAVSFSLAGAGTSGFGLGRTRAGYAAASVLAADWAAMVYPAVGVKLISDLLGFAMWFLTGDLAGREFRELARLTQLAQAEAEESQNEAAERRRESDVAREREITHREIHEHLLPIVDSVAAGKPLTEALVRVARREADRARRLILDGRVEHGAGFAALVSDVRETYMDAGLHITPVLRIVAEPPLEVGEAVAGATREALSNVVKYAGSKDEVNLYVESTEAGVEVVVRDRGAGFDPSQVRPGNGFGVTYEAVRRRGGEVLVRSRPGKGTKVTFRWPAHSAPSG
jgi:signal transduction histidine kinase